MKKYLIILLLIPALACGQLPAAPVAQPAPQAAPAPVKADQAVDAAFAVESWTVTVEQVHVRDAGGASAYDENGAAIYAIQGDTFPGYCDGVWCWTSGRLKVWQACTSEANWADYEVCR
jgi:hypothetical protein